jgi:Pyruvate/2-oxoacid:ferredoxin oxidoreductase delta subunit
MSSQWIGEEAVKKGLKTVIQQIDRLEDIRMPAEDDKPLIGFAFPTHGFNAAPIMLKFIAGFPSHLCKEIFLLNTRAGMKLSKLFIPGLSGIALMLPAFMLWLKGYKCIGFKSVDLPSNWISLHPGIKKSVIESIYTKREPQVKKFANGILSGEKIYRGLYSFPADLLVSPIAAGYYIGGRFFLAKTFIANNKCNNCGICIKECPTASIKYVNDRPYWKLTCESCMRCMNNCPQRAIETAHGMATLIIILVSAANTWLIMFLISSLNISSDALWWKIASQFLSIAVMVGFAALIYLVMHYLMRLSPFSYLVRFTSLTTFPFWRRYRYRSGKMDKTGPEQNKSSNINTK